MVDVACIATQAMVDVIATQMENKSLHVSLLP